MATNTITYRGSVPALRKFIRDLPGVLAGTKNDEFGLGLQKGMTSRMAFTFFALVGRAFDVKSKGGRGDDGIQWAPNTEQYLAYQKGRTRSKARTGERNKGSYRVNRERHLTGAQKRVWTKENNRAIADIIRELADAGMTADQQTIKAKAAVRAWAATRVDGAESLISHYPARPDTVLVDEGDLRRSIQPGELTVIGVTADYTKGGKNQIVRRQRTDFVVGSADPKAAFHQNAEKLQHGDGKKGTVRRQMWPDELTDSWLREIVGQVTQFVESLPRLFATMGR